MSTFLTCDNPSYVNRAAFVTSTTLSCAAIGLTVACVTATSTVSAVALGVFAAGALAASMGSIWAWCFENNRTITQYVHHTGDVTAKAFVVIVQFVAQNVFQAAVEGLCRAVSDEAHKRVRRWFNKDSG